MELAQRLLCKRKILNKTIERNLMRFFILALAGLISMNAMARTQGKQITETLHQVYINGEKTSYTAQLGIDQAKKQMEVTIYNDVCGTFSEVKDPNILRCKAMPLYVIHFSTPIQKVSRSCGSYIYEGRKDETPVDGLLTEMTVVDHTRRTCKDTVASTMIVDIKNTNIRERRSAEFHIEK